MARTISPYKDAEAALEKLKTARRSEINYLSKSVTQSHIEQLIKIDAAIAIVKQAMNEEPTGEYSADDIYDLADSPEDA